MQVQNAIEVAWNPSSDQALKTQAFEYLNQVRSNPSAWPVCLSLFIKDPPASEVVRHMSLELVNAALQSQSLAQQDADNAKDNILNYVRLHYGGSKTASDSPGIQNKLAQTLTFLFNVLYISEWGSYFRDLYASVEEDKQSAGSDQTGTLLYLRILGSVHDEIADQMIQTTEEKSELNMKLKDLIRERDAQFIASSWQDILSRWQHIDHAVVALCLTIISRWVSWTDINLIATDGILQYLFQIAGQQNAGHPESASSKARDAAIGVFTELVAKKMQVNNKVELLRFLNVDAVVATLTAAPTLQNASTPDYDTDMAETVAKLVNNVVFDIVNALNDAKLDVGARETADRLLQAFTPHLLRFLGDEYDEVCSTIMPALNEQLMLFRKFAKSPNGLQSPYREMLSPILQALIAKMRYDDTSSWGEEDEETDEAEFQELRKRLKVAQQSVAIIDENLYQDVLIKMIESTFYRCKQEGESLNWRDLDVALLEMYMLGELAVRNSGSNQKKAPSSAGSQRLAELMSLMLDSNVPAFGHPTAQLHVMEICVRYHFFFDQQSRYLPRILEDFVRFAHSENKRVRHRAWHFFLRFVRTLRPKLSDVAETIVYSISDLLAIRAVVPPQEDDEESSSSSHQGPQDPTFQSQLFLFEAIGSLASIPDLDRAKQHALVQSVTQPLVSGMKDYGNAAARGDERAIFQTHHYIEATGNLARGFSDWVPGKSSSPVPEQVAAAFRNASEVILDILGGLKHSFMIREASRFAFARLIGVLGFALLEQLPKWIDGLLGGSSSREEVASFLRLLAQVVYGFKRKIYPSMDQLLSPLLQRVYAGFSQRTEGTDDSLQLGELRREYLNFLNVLLMNKLDGVLVSPTNQSTFEMIITTLEHFARDTSEPIDARSAVAILNRMVEAWGGPDVFSPSRTNNANTAAPSPSLPGFDNFMISRFSPLTWSVMTNPSFHPKEPTTAKVVQEIATLQQAILTKTGAAYITSLQQKELPDIGLQPAVIEEYLRSIATMNGREFKLWLTKFLQQGPSG